MKQLSKVEIGKMRQLADFLETVQPSSFDLSSWVVSPYAPAKTYLWGLIQTQPECGFAGCAMGWAAHSKLFPGLYLDQGWIVTYKGQQDFDAVVKLFGITKRNADFIFTTDGYKAYKNGGGVTPGMVADRLNKFADKVESRLKRAVLKEERRRNLLTSPLDRGALRVVA